MVLDTPVYHLDGVVHAKTERENFDGPLDLILSLLSKNKMEIQEIQISLILNQYLHWMSQRQELDLEVASEFVAMAAHLMYIKTRMLLSIQDEEAASEMEDLIASLEERRRSENYAKICQATVLLKSRYEVGKDYFAKRPEPMQSDRTYQYCHQPGDLRRTLQRMLQRSGEKTVLSATAFQGIVGREPYPVTEKAREILAWLLRIGASRFQVLFRRSRSRSEVVATFLAVLELCKRKRICLCGSGSDCVVTPGEEAVGSDQTIETMEFQ